MAKPSRGAGEGRGTRPAAHELARYEALFAARTRGMKSSAMREMMALTERPDVISLAGGLSDTSTFPPERYAKLMAAVAAESTAKALQYGSGMFDIAQIRKHCGIPQLMGACAAGGLRRGERGHRRHGHGQRGHGHRRHGHGARRCAVLGKQICRPEY